MHLETIDSVLTLKHFTKAKHCWVCTIILRDALHKHASPYNRRFKNTNCCERCKDTGGEQRREKWLYEQVVDICENRDLNYEDAGQMYKTLLDSIKYY